MITGLSCDYFFFSDIELHNKAPQAAKIIELSAGETLITFPPGIIECGINRLPSESKKKTKA
jgi:hypothetical protein